MQVETIKKTFLIGMFSASVLLNLWLSISGIDQSVAVDHLSSELKQVKQDRAVLVEVCNSALRGENRKQILARAEAVGVTILEKKDPSGNQGVYAGSVQLDFRDNKLMGLDLPFSDPDL